jgi:hypothetical protein
MVYQSNSPHFYAIAQIFENDARGNNISQPIYAITISLVPTELGRFGTVLDEIKQNWCRLSDSN